MIIVSVACARRPRSARGPLKGLFASAEPTGSRMAMKLARARGADSIDTLKRRKIVIVPTFERTSATMSENKLRDLFYDILKDIYFAERHAFRRWRGRRNRRR